MAPDELGAMGGSGLTGAEGSDVPAGDAAPATPPVVTLSEGAKVTRRVTTNAANAQAASATTTPIATLFLRGARGTVGGSLDTGATVGCEPRTRAASEPPETQRGPSCAPPETSVGGATRFDA